ncbi:30S ribosomal protein S26e [[Eubacterium] cellulosolvens]
MPKKRSSRGRSKGGKGASGLVQCDSCGALIPRDKAKHATRYVSLVDRSLAKELRSQGAQIASQRVTRTYCVSCAVHRGVVKVRSKIDRKQF